MNFKCEDTLLRFTLSKLSTAISFASVVSIAGVSPYALANTQVTTLEKTKLSANKRVESKSQTELDSVSVSSNLMQDINDVLVESQIYNIYKFDTILGADPSRGKEIMFAKTSFETMRMRHEKIEKSCFS